MAAAGGREVKWLPLPHGKSNANCRSKVTSELIQLLRQLLSVPSEQLSGPAHQALQELLSERGGRGEGNKMAATPERDEENKMAATSERDEEMAATPERDEENKMAATSERDEEMAATPERYKENKMAVTAERDEENKMAATAERDEESKMAATAERDEENKMDATAERYEENKMAATLERDEENKMAATPEKGEENKMAATLEKNKQDKEESKMVSKPESSLPLTALVYSDPSLLSELLSLLNSMEGEESSSTPPPSAGKPGVAPSNLTPTLFVNLIHFLQLNCTDHSCFFQPIMAVLGAGGGELPLSLPFLTFVSRLTTELARHSLLEQLGQFAGLGGAHLILKCLVRSCHHNPDSSLGGLLGIVSRLGLREVPRPFQEGSRLVNFLPLATLSAEPNRSPTHDLCQSSLPDLPSRMSTFHHTFQGREEEVVLTAILPHPILLYAVQLFQPVGLLQSGPSALLVEAGTQPGLTPPLSITPLLSTKGLGCVKVELRHPTVVQEVKVHMYRPAVSDSISLSHMHLLGTGYGGEQEDGRREENREEKTHPR